MVKTNVKFLLVFPGGWTKRGRGAGTKLSFFGGLALQVARNWVGFAENYWNEWPIPEHEHGIGQIAAKIKAKHLFEFWTCSFIWTCLNSMICEAVFRLCKIILTKYLLEKKPLIWEIKYSGEWFLISISTVIFKFCQLWWSRPSFTRKCYSDPPKSATK